MIDSRKLQYYTMAHRLRGYADGLDDNQNRQLIQMLRWSADMLEEAWDEYAVANGYQDIKVPLHVPVREQK
jgi:hypothetical protein